jgi:amidase
VLEQQRATFEQLGCVVDDAVPDLTGADQVFLTLRAWMSAQTLGPILDAHRDLLKPEAIWQIEYGRRVSASALGEAMQQHTALLDRVRQFHERFPFLVCAVSPVPPFDASVTWPREVAGVPMDNYIAWMAAAYRVSLMMGPAMAVPAGFTSDGLPVGLQIVGRIRDDLGVLQLARAFEQATGLGRRRPPLAVD